MTTQYQVETGCAEVSNMLLKVADQNGWFGHPAPGEHRPWLLAFPEARRCGWNSCDFSSYETINVTAFIELLRAKPEKKERAMATDYQVETGCVEVQDMLLEIAKTNGWVGFPGSHGRRQWLTISDISPCGGWNNRAVPGYETVSVAQFIKLLRQGPTPKEPPPIMIVGGHEIAFEANGIVIPCAAFIDTATVDEIHKRLHAT